MGHQLLGNLFGELGIEPATNLDRHQFLVLALVVCIQFRAFQLEVGLFGVCLGMHRNILACRHRNRPATMPATPATITLL
jgi:hypothetical protein